MLRLDRIIGNAKDPDLAHLLDPMLHRGAVEYLFVPEADVGSHRLRLLTDRGTDCGVALPRTDRLRDGAVLHLDADRAIVVRVGAPQILRLRCTSQEAALQLGWNAGNLHWRVRFEGKDLVVLLDGPRDSYLARIAPLLAGGEVVADAV